MAHYFSTSDVVEIFGQPAWRIRRLYELGVLDAPPRIGISRAIPASTLPRRSDANPRQDPGGRAVDAGRRTGDRGGEFE